MFSAAQSPIVAAPRKTLTASQLDVLREIDRLGRAYKARNGWMLGGRFRKAATCAALVRLGLAREEFRNGKHLLVLTYAGRAAVAPAAPPLRDD